MRAWVLMVAATLVAAVGNAVAVPAKVTDMLRDPHAYMDKHIAVSGVITRGRDFAVGGWVICPLQAERALAGHAATHEHPICIDLKLSADADTQIEKYYGALATVAGLYWHRCLPDIREREPEIAKDDCTDSGLNGRIGVESVAIRGYLEGTSLDGIAHETQPSEWHDTTLEPADSAALNDLVARFIAAMRTKDVDALAMLYAKESRGFVRVGLQQPLGRHHWLYLSHEMAVTHAGAERPELGYRLYGDGWLRSLCLCRRKECAGRWPQHFDEVGTNIASAIVCRTLSRQNGTWWLDDR